MLILIDGLRVESRVEEKVDGSTGVYRALQVFNWSVSLFCEDFNETPYLGRYPAVSLENWTATPSRDTFRVRIEV